MLNTASGCPISHSLAYVGGAGRSAGLPSGAPAFTHCTIVFFSASLRRRSLRNSPCEGSACHGGIVPFDTRVSIDFAHGRASLNVSNDIGATVSGRWQFVQFL